MATRNKIAVGLGILGILVAGYLTYIKTSHNIYTCGLGECETVQSSKYSLLFGIPVAAYGLAFYIAAVILMFSKKFYILQLWLLWGLIFSSYLTYLELFVIKAICGWCVISFVIIILMNLLVSPNSTEIEL